MKTFTFSNTQAQRNEVIFYTFHPDLIDASEAAKGTYKNTLQTHPGVSTPFENESGEKSITINPDAPIFQTWQAAAQHAQQLLREKVATNSHWRMFYVSLLSLVVVFLAYFTTPQHSIKKIESMQQTQEKLQELYELKLPKNTPSPQNLNFPIHNLCTFYIKYI